MQIRIRNTIGLAKADLTVEPGKIALVGGPHGAGKTSLTQAIGAALTSNWRLRDATTKKELSGVLREGTEAGVIQARIEGKGGIKIDLPSGEITTEGVWDAWPALAVGTQRLMGIGGAKERANALLSVIDAEPSREDFEAAVPKQMSKENRDALWTRICKDGWDATWKAAREAGIKHKGSWEELTKANYGPTKAREWHPEAIDPLDGEEAEPYEEALQQAQSDYDAAIAKQAVSAEEVARLRAESERMPELRKRLVDLDEELAAAVEAHAKALEEREQLPVAVVLKELPQCPHCKKHLVVKTQVRTGGSVAIMGIEKPPAEETLTDAQLKQRRLAIAGADGEVVKTKDEVSRLEREKYSVGEALQSAGKADDKLGKLGDWSGEDAEYVTQCREALETARYRIGEFRRWQEAKRLANRIANNIELQKVLAPDGVRQKVLGDRLAAFNEKLAELTGFLAMDAEPLRVVVAEKSGECTVVWGERPYAQLSESEQWRADLVIHAALARLSGVPLIVIDRLDLLLPPLRPGVVKLIGHLGVSAVITMAAQGTDKLPKRGPWGSVFWVEHGNLEEV